jgi:hypothetical protein
MSEDNKVKLTATECKRLRKAEPDLMRQLSAQNLLFVVKDDEYKARMEESYRIWQKKLAAVRAEAGIE